MNKKKLLDPKAAKAIEEFNAEMGTEIGHVDKSQDGDFIYVHSGDPISREIIEEAERQFANRNKEE
ncbi:hypothetical protein CACET_c11150 [Clostridium aceticum]|uniref:Uncharacterized protein n=1 Tax=Clostridium aceticum TaxID=84022 RepID=A0A0D8I8D2_9CLOT|nr:hypothetical protein [Clostridium aceticum]AKL94580.1 hypothetical protein CACET_c11150 [Clostridium aceticum]KJF26508.1 hypothetical protein TZ02_13375 [Clostridium aceticum]